MSLSKEKREQILTFIQENVREHPRDIVRLTREQFQLTNTTVLRYMQALCDQGKIEAKGKTKDREYAPVVLVDFSKKVPLDTDTEEGRLWLEVSPYLKDLPENVYRICQYGFTEMVNNAIEHSEGENMIIDLEKYFDQVILRVLDDGVGIYNKIQEQYHLDDPLHSILELSKGKVTTDPENHTGEGIFFTSRMFDWFGIFSGNANFVHSEDGFDVLFPKTENEPGTMITMQISTTSTRATLQIFSQYTDEESDYGFNKTIVPVNLATYGDDQLVSRSQAKRLLTRFDRFKQVVLDFKDVKLIGQAFADEIFRVFKSANPEVTISYINTEKPVEEMILHVLESK